MDEGPETRRKPRRCPYCYQICYTPKEAVDEEELAEISYLGVPFWADARTWKDPWEGYNHLPCDFKYDSDEEEDDGPKHEYALTQLKRFLLMTRLIICAMMLCLVSK